MSIFRAIRPVVCVFAACSFVAWVGCGGDVTSNSTTGSSGAGSGSGSSSGSTDPIGDGVIACADLCHKLEVNNCGGSPQDCAAYCQGRIADAGQCAAQLGELYICWAANAQLCPTDPPPECKAEEDTYEACVAVYGCAPGDCMGSGGPNGVTECSCSQVCAMKTYTTSCKTDMAGTSCECFVDNVSAGTCQGESDQACDINKGCCASLFMK